MVCPNSIGAFLFVKINMDDPNADIPVDEAISLGNRLIKACDEIFTLINDEMTEEEIQYEMYEIGKRHYGIDKKILREWFRDLYLLLYGQQSGPRWGTWISMFGVENFKNLLRDRLEKPFYFI